MDHSEREVVPDFPYNDLDPQDFQKLQERLGEWNEFCDHVVKHEDKDFLLDLYNRKREDLMMYNKNMKKIPLTIFSLSLPITLVHSNPCVMPLKKNMALYPMKS